MTEKSILDGFGNRLGLLKKAFSLSQDAKIFLKKFYKGRGRLDIYEQDVGLVDFYYKECRIDNGLKNDTFDDVKFEEEARRIILGKVEEVAEQNVEQSFSASAILSESSSEDKTETPEQQRERFQNLMARIFALNIEDDPDVIISKGNSSGHEVVSYKDAVNFLSWFKETYPGIKLIEPFDDDIPF